MVSTSSARVVVLVVEDEPLVRFDAVQSLEDAGFEVIDAYDAENAIWVLEHRRDIGALFTDVHMPGRLNGADLAHLVHDRWPGIHLILTSGISKREAYELPQACRFIAKPYDGVEVASTIQQLVA